jgi:hypothetical protein
MKLESLKSVKTPTPAEIAKKHNVDIDVINKQLKMGIAVEVEHTTDKNVAREIALDHLNEFPDYYDRLDNMENNK